MEAEVIAAIVGAPTVLVTAVASYMAGRLQAKAALKGPVSAIRRQHQREAYAALVREVDAFELRVSRTRAFTDVIHADPARARSEGNEWILQQVAERCAENAETHTVSSAVSLVNVEGPEKVNDACLGVSSAVAALFGRIVSDRFKSLTGDITLRDFLEAELEIFNDLHEARRRFVRAAQDHLNSD